MISVRQSIPCRRTHRSGITLIEMMVSAILVASVAFITVPGLTRIWKQRDVVQQRQAALEEVTNLMEHATATEWDNLTAEHLKTLPAAQRLQSDYSSPELEIHVEATDQNSRRIHIRFAWVTPLRQPSQPVTLSAWVYRQGAES